MQKITVSLYPGFLTKSQGKIVWHAILPKFDQSNDEWLGVNSIEITSCIHDPWPHTSGGKNCVVELK